MCRQGWTVSIMTHNTRDANVRESSRPAAEATELSSVETKLPFSSIGFV